MNFEIGKEFKLWLISKPTQREKLKYLRADGFILAAAPNAVGDIA